jgi:hypothetical protein
MSEVIFLIEDAHIEDAHIEDAPEGGFTARALGYSIYTQADTWEELKEAIQDAITCHFGDQQ